MTRAGLDFENGMKVEQVHLVIAEKARERPNNVLRTSRRVNKEPAATADTNADKADGADHHEVDSIMAGEAARKEQPVSNPSPLHIPLSKKPKVTLDTLINPRSIMNDDELGEVLARRNLRRRSRDETHPEVVARIAAADASERTAKVELLLAA